MTDKQVPIEYELLHTATLADINEDEDENDVEWSAFGLIYALGVLSFSDAGRGAFVFGYDMRSSHA